MAKLATSIKLSGEAMAKLDETGRRMGGFSRAVVIEVLLHYYADKLYPEMPIPANLLAHGRATNKGAENVQSAAKKKPGRPRKS